MVDKKDVDKIILRAISKFAVEYAETVDKIQVIFRLNQDGEVDYITCVNKKMRHTVKLKQLIGWNFYNGIVDDKICVLLNRVNQESPGSYVMAGLEGINIYYRLYNITGHKIRDIDADELLK